MRQFYSRDCNVLTHPSMIDLFPTRVRWVRFCRERIGIIRHGGKCSGNLQEIFRNGAGIGIEIGITVPPRVTIL